MDDGEEKFEPLQRYPMPAVGLGDPVIWTDDPENADPTKHCAAIVTAVFEEMVDLSVIQPDAATLDPKRGVRHLKDPNRTAITHAGQGVWFHRHNIPLAIDATLLERLDAIEAAVTATPTATPTK